MVPRQPPIDSSTLAARCALALVAALLLSPATASAQYVQFGTQTTPGAVTFTGNSLGLDGDKNRNAQGTRGGIGTFITTDTSQQDTNPSPGSGTPFPPGTTNDWHLNRSEATLRLPVGATVKKAVLVWGGSYASDDSADNVFPFIDDPVTFTTPAATTSVTKTDGRQSSSVSGGGHCNSNSGCFYTRSADVTALVQAGGAGIYAVGRVPATQGTNDNNNPVAGWTLAVIYEDFTLPIRNMTLFGGLEHSGGAAAQVSGFCTPPFGSLSGRLAVSSIEGDAMLTGDKFLFGPTSSLNNNNRVFGPRNPIDNFFAGQIADDNGELDTTGTFGDRNHTPGSPKRGSRQGWDITNVDASSQLRNDQTAAFAQGTTDGDNYYIMALGLQIDISAPRFFTTSAKEVSPASAVSLGATLTYTVHVDNTLGTADANNVVFFDAAPAGTAFVAGSVTVGGAVQPGADPAAGIPLGTIAKGNHVDVTFQVQVTSLPGGSNPNIVSNSAHWDFDFVSCSGQPPLSSTTATNTVTTEILASDLSIAKAFTTTPAVAGLPVTYTLTVQNAGPSAVTNAVVTDVGTTPSLTGASWTCAPQSSGSSCGAASGSGALSTTATLPSGGGVVYTVTGTLPANTPAGPLSNTASVAPPPGVTETNIGNNTANASVPIVNRADVRITKSGPASASRGATIAYTLVVTNDGPSVAENVLVTDPAPNAGVSSGGLSGSGTCHVSPGCTLAPGASETITATFTIAPSYPPIGTDPSQPDPIPNVASVTAATTDPNPLNNTARASTALDANISDVAITKTDGTTTVTAGGTTTYTITVTNAGPATALNATVTDVFDPTVFGSVTWQCVASGASSCAASGPQTGDINTIVTVVPGDSVVFTAQASVLPSATGDATNTATVATIAAEADPNSANNRATDTDTIQPLADVSITKTGPSSIAAGSSAVYTVVVRNDGPSTATHIQASDRVFDAANTPHPELISGFTAPAGVTCNIRPYFDPATSTTIALRFCDIPSLAAGATATFTVTLSIPADFAGTSLTNVAFIDPVAYTAPDPDTTDYTSSVPIAITRQSDLVVTKDGPSSLAAGSTVSYFVKVTNVGPSKAANIVVDDPVPTGLISRGYRGVCSALPCTVPELAVGANFTITADVFVPRDYAGPPTYTNIVTVSSSASSDPTPINNIAAVSTLVGSEQADLKVEKTGPSSIAPGQSIQYTAKVTNLGPGPAANVVWSDVLPVGTTFASGTPPGGTTTCTAPSPGNNLGSCVTPLLLIGESVQFAFTATASTDLVPGATILNVASVSADTPDFNPTNNRTELATRVAAGTDADVQLTIADAPDPVVVGGAVVYTIVVTNSGPATASSLTMTATLPAGISLVSAVPSAGSCAATTCALGSLAPGGTATITVTTTTTAAGAFTVTATATATENDPVTANNTASQTTTVAASTADADLEIQKSGPTVLAPGVASAYQIVVTNHGPGQATAIQIDDTLPAGLTFVANAGACVIAYPCRIEVLDPGQSVTMFTTFTVDSSAAGSITNTATVSAGTVDPVLTNNTSSVTSAIGGAATADLSIVKRDSPDAVVAGTALGYTLSISNGGPSAAPSVVVTDTLPAGVTLVSARSNVGSCSASGSVVTCQLGTMADGAIAAIDLETTAPTSLPTPNPMINTATVSSSLADPNPANNSASEPTTVVAQADVTITKTGFQFAIPGGPPAPYVITVTNNGPSSATAVTVADPTPAGALPGTVGGACSAFPCLLGTLAPLESKTILTTLSLPAGFTVGNSVVNTATVAAASPDPVPTNNTSSVSTTAALTVADLQVTKAGPSSVLTGKPVSYTIVVTNAGPSDATGVVISDPTPAPLAFVSASAPCAGGFPCSLGTMAANASVTVTATYQAPNFVAGITPVTNTVTVSSSTPEPRPADNTASVVTQIRPSGSMCDFDGDGRAEVVVGVGRRDGGPHVRVLSFPAAGGVVELFHFDAYGPAFPGGVFVACGDLTGDGYPEIVTGADVGGDPHVEAFQLDPSTYAATTIASFYAYQPNLFTGGVRVAIGDVDGDGVGDIITGAGASGGPHVEAFSLAGGLHAIASFYAYAPNFDGGVFVASCDMNGDGRAEIITGVGRRDGGSHVRVLSLAGGTVTELVSFQTFFPAFPGGVFVSCGDLNGDGVNEIVVGADVGGDAHIRAIALVNGAPADVISFYAYAPPFAGGVRVAVGDVDGDGRLDIVSGAGAGGGPHVKVFAADGIRQFSEMYSLFAYPSTFTGGVYVASGRGR